MNTEFFDKKGQIQPVLPVSGTISGNIIVEKITEENITEHLCDIREYFKEGENSSFFIDKNSQVVNLVVKLSDTEYCNISWSGDDYNEFTKFIKTLTL